MPREDRASRRDSRGGLRGRVDGACPQAQAEAEGRNGDRRDDGSSKTAPLHVTLTPLMTPVVLDPCFKTRTGGIRLPSVTVIPSSRPDREAETRQDLGRR